MHPNHTMTRAKYVLNCTVRYLPRLVLYDDDVGNEDGRVSLVAPRNVLMSAAKCTQPPKNNSTDETKNQDTNLIY